jgi:hypothetical protein
MLAWELSIPGETDKNPSDGTRVIIPTTSNAILTALAEFE